MNLTSKIYDSVRETNEQRVFKHWHASSIAECPRAHYFKRLGVQPVDEVGAGKILRWRIGHHTEAEVRDHLELIYGPTLRSNKRFTNKELDLTGEVDNIVDKHIIEVKSVHPFAMKWIVKDDKPYLHHEYQQHAYALLTDVEKISYVYVGLDGQMTDFETPVKQEILNNVKKRLDILNKAWENKIPPECICKVDGKDNKEHPLWKGQMQYCDYRTVSTCCDEILLEQLEEEE